MKIIKGFCIFKILECNLHLTESCVKYILQEDTDILYALSCAIFSIGLMACQSVVSFAVCQRS
jgi:hypothetical protein